MNNIQAPYLELSFYYPDKPEYLVFAEMIKALSDLGAEFLGEGIVHRGSGIRDKSFTSTSDYDRELLHFGLKELDNLISDPDLLLSEVFMRDAVGSKPNTRELLTYVNVSSEAASIDRHPIEICADGTMFTFQDEESLALEQMAGERAYKRFLQVIKITQPAYAAITSEEVLKCPTDLNNDPRNYAFSDFYVSQHFVGESNLDQIRALFIGAYHEEVNDGVYISGSPLLNPENIRFLSDEPQYKLDEKVGKIIGTLSSGTYVSEQ